MKCGQKYIFDDDQRLVKSGVNKIRAYTCETDRSRCAIGYIFIFQ